MPESSMAVTSLIGTLIAMVAIFFGAYYFTKAFGGGYQKSFLGEKSKIEVIDRKIIGKDQSLLIVKIEDKIWFLSATSQNINKIDMLESEDILKTGEPLQMNFLSTLKDSVESLKEKKK